MLPARLVVSRASRRWPERNRGSSNSHKAINKLLTEVEKRAKESGFRFTGAKKGNDDKPDTHFDSLNIVTITDSKDAGPHHRLVGGTVFHFCGEDQRGAYDYLFVDEAGQVSLGNLVAMAGAAANIVLVGDQMQLPQPVQGVHPGETGLSSLEYLLEGRATVPEDRGILLKETRRLHPTLCAFISEAIYDGRLEAHPSTRERYLAIRSCVHPALKSAGSGASGEAFYRFFCGDRGTDGPGNQSGNPHATEGGPKIARHRGNEEGYRGAGAPVGGDHAPHLG